MDGDGDDRCRDDMQMGQIQIEMAGMDVSCVGSVGVGLISL